MSELDRVIAAAYNNKGAADKVNKVYVTLFRTTLYMPVYQQDDKDEPFVPLYTIQEGEKYFISVFDALTRLKTWAENEYKDVDYTEMLGADVLRCIGHDRVYLCLNAGTDVYKEFSPEEIVHLKKMLGKIDALKR